MKWIESWFELIWLIPFHWLLWLGWFLCGLRAADAAALLRKERDQPKQAKQPPINQLMKPNEWSNCGMKWAEWFDWAASFIEEFHSSNYGIKGYMFCLQLPSIPASLPSSFISIIKENNNSLYWLHWLRD